MYLFGSCVAGPQEQRAKRVKQQTTATHTYTHPLNFTNYSTSFIILIDIFKHGHMAIALINIVRRIALVTELKMIMFKLLSFKFIIVSNAKTACFSDFLCSNN